MEDLVQAARKAVDGAGLRKEFNREYATNEDFERVRPDLKRVAVVGCTGAGKSALIDTLCGFRMEYDEAAGKYAWTTPEELLPFKTSTSCESITRSTSFANAHFLGLPGKPFVVVDTPGHDDTDPDKLTELATDFHVKLQKIGYVNMILVIHKDYTSNRLDPATFELLEKISCVFQKSGRDVWKHVVIGYSKVDEDQRGWKAGLEDKIASLQRALRDQTKRFESPCTVDVPVLTFSCCQSSQNDDRIFGDYPFKSEGKEAAGQHRVSHVKSYETLWQMLGSLPPLPSSDLKVFEGLQDKYRKAVEQRDAYARIASARKHFMQNAGWVAGFIFVVFIWGPLNLTSTATEEIFFVAGFVYLCGYHLLLDWFRVTWDDFVLPQLARRGWARDWMRLLPPEPDFASGHPFRQKEDASTVLPSATGQLPIPSAGPPPDQAKTLLQ
eukprot:TRINITY_DN1895_c0_g1_i1.p2 TRINITY_DN1895_c0_g1~~TRINITY_DN1895_c0_g1_i1.p2  ORF type:complete len:464 (+),score=131.12 TRINITY_DN1895_c0_g1_i1:73-1392(+)